VHKIKKGISVLAMAIGCLLVFASSAFAAAGDTTDGVKTAVTPYFTDLQQFALDMVPYALGVIAVGVVFGLARSWYKRSRG
jgi:hypothetical protein